MLYLWTFCEKPTKFADYHKLSKHVARFHSDFNQKNKGTKRSKGEREEVSPKRIRWNVTGIPDKDDYYYDDSDDGFYDDSDNGCE